MSREVGELERLASENAILRDSLVWIAKNSLDSKVRTRSKETLRTIDPNISLDAEKNDTEIYGEWCI